ncbi:MULTISPECIES: hypothetical protein [Olivibacter]|jgi:hypothetical protein|uniref:Lipoprotein n=1 Tax=Olivibacter oleidegradans TaxID=760123 RepID=A0ABV6HNF8_9SPHI|nr:MULTISPECIES: hypothetical protein [Olivibacter]MCL4640667.1 hypothetical protein [Olivibacter sp. UJ_SKK_5.1]MDM8173390.1 hypothetical protein [Olivibacter sp. 47]MDX3915177.1 hypothetical protein [Pseudosphingobacterium sp.]QEL03161.1 hypothetical protein FKG96_20810 [Olivibacter sp. LS-1]
MKNLKKLFATLSACLFLSIIGCGQNSQENETEGDSYRDTVEAPTTNDNNMRNDQPTDELTTKDSLSTDSI